MRRTYLLALLFVATSAAAQGAVKTIDPGMTRKDVIARLGPPAAVRTYDSTTYLLYPNGCKKCGMQDLVVLQHDAVVDAIFRSSDRQYTGTSSSPASLSPEQARARKPNLVVPLKAAPAAAPADSGAPAKPDSSASP